MQHGIKSFTVEGDPCRTSAAPKLDLRPNGSAEDLVPFTDKCPKCTDVLTHEFRPGFLSPESTEDLQTAWLSVLGRYAGSIDATSKELEANWYHVHGSIEGEHLKAKCSCGYSFLCQCADHPKSQAT